MHSFVTSLFDFNASTLSGAIDVIAVLQEDGSIKSTPFHVRFGKFRVLRPKEKRVFLTVNNNRVDLEMRLSKEGEAFFMTPKGKELETEPVQEIAPLAVTVEDGAVNVGVPIAVSTLPTATVPLARPIAQELDTSVHTGGSGDTPTPSVPVVTAPVDMDNSEITTAPMQLNVSSILSKPVDLSDVGSVTSHSTDSPRHSLTQLSTPSHGTPLHSPTVNDLSATLPDTGPTTRPRLADDVITALPRPRLLRNSASLPDMMHLHSSASEQLASSTLTPQPSTDRDVGLSFDTQRSTVSHSKSTPGSPVHSPLKTDEKVVSLLDFKPVSVVVPKSTKRKKRRHKHRKDKDGMLSSAETTPQLAPSVPKVEAEGGVGKGDSGHFRGNSGMEIHTLGGDTIVQVDSKSAEMVPLVTPTPPPVPMPELELPKSSLSQRWMNFFFRRNQNAPTANVTTTMSTKPPSVPLSTDTTVAISTTKSLPSGRASVTSDEGSDVGSDAYESDSSYGSSAFHLDLLPTSKQLESMGLKLGSNTITFDIYTGRTEKRSSVSCKLYLWRPHAKVVISDIDGTITKSDVWGHIYYYLGRDWTHSGVAKLYSKIKRNGYEILYLTSRAIGQADTTRNYIESVQQDDGVRLPSGPVITSPDRLVAAFTREVIRRKPQEFKIAALNVVKALFPPNVNCFYAGFGNRDTDMVAYLAAGVPEGKIFIINPLGQIGHVNRTFQSSYTSMTALVDKMFPITRLVRTLGLSEVRSPVLKSNTAPVNNRDVTTTTTTTTTTTSTSAASTTSSYDHLSVRTTDLPTPPNSGEHHAMSVGRREGRPIVLDERFNTFNFWKPNYGLIMETPEEAVPVQTKTKQQHALQPSQTKGK